MIYYLYAPHFLFSFNWNDGIGPQDWHCVYFTFCGRPTAYQFQPALSGLVAQTYIPRCQCPLPTRPFSEDYEPRYNPVEYEFLYTNWLTRTPEPPWGVPFSEICETGQFRFGNHGTYSVLVDFLGKGGRELWRINAGGKMYCGWYKNQKGELVEVVYPKQGEYTYEGEREITDIWERYKDYGGMGFPQLLWLSTFSPVKGSLWISPDGKYKVGDGVAQPYTNFPSLTALLPYKEGGYIHLFDYPEPKFSSDKLAELLSIEQVTNFDGYVYFRTSRSYITGVGWVPVYEVIGYRVSRTILLNLFYRAWDVFLPFAIPIPRPEGMWIMTLSKSLKDKKRIERKTQTKIQWVYQVENYPIWEYKARWYLANSLGISFQKETTFPKSSETSFIWYLYPLLKTSGELGVYVYEIDYLARKWVDKCDLYAGIYLASGRKLTFNPSDTQNVPDPTNLILFPPRDYPNFLSGWDFIYYIQAHPKVKHRRFTQCFSAIPPYSSFPLGRPSPGATYNWHTATGNFLFIGWQWDDNEGWYRWVARDYLGTPITEGAVDVNLPPPDVLNSKLGKPIIESIFLSFLQRPEMPETILFWFQPEDPNFAYILASYWSHLQSVLYGYPDLASIQAHLPYEFCLNPKDPRPITWGNLKMMVWRKGEGVVAERDLGRYPIQYLFPAIEKQTGAIYLPLLADMQGDGSGVFQLLVFKRNDWSPDIYDFGGE